MNLAFTYGKKVRLEDLDKAHQLFKRTIKEEMKEKAKTQEEKELEIKKKNSK